MDHFVDICSDYLDISSLITLSEVCVQFHQYVVRKEVWYYILRRAGFKRLSSSLLSCRFDGQRLAAVYVHVRDRSACRICWAVRSRPIRLPNYGMSAMCTKCEGNLLCDISQIRCYLKSLPFRPSMRSLLSKLIVAKRRNTKKRLFWVNQVRELCEL